MILVRVVDSAFAIYELMLLARILLSWFPQVDWYHPITRFLYDWTEPVLGWFRRIIPPLGPIDISPIVVFFVLNIVRRFVVSLLLQVVRGGALWS